MDFAELTVEERVGTGKSLAKKLRFSGKVPAVIYGNGKGAVPLAVDARAFRQILLKDGHNVIFKLKGLDKSRTAMIKDIQYHPLKETLVHIDFKTVAMDEKIEAAVPLELIGEAEGVKEGGVLNQTIREVRVKALPNEIPERFQLEISELNVGDGLRVSDLPLFDNVEILENPEDQVASVVAPTKIEEVVPEEEEEEEGEEGEAAEGEEGAPEEGGEEEGTTEGEKES